VWVVIGVVAFGGDDDEPADDEPAATAPSTNGGATLIPPPSLHETEGPWPPLVRGLEERDQELGLPAPSDTIYHVHAQLKVFVDGDEQPVPADIGIDSARGFISSIHTHDEKGIIHMEAVEPYDFTLGDFMTIWGVKFTNSQLGGYEGAVETYVNGKRVPDGPAAKLEQGDRVVIVVGEQDSAPKDFEPDPSFTP
jgi:hypothetical protein